MEYYKKLINIFILFFGLILKFFFKRSKTKNIIIIGSSHGYGFSDNGKHLFQFWYQSHHEVYFVTRSYKLYKKLINIYGNKILFNYFPNSINKILSSKIYFFTHSSSDVLFIHNKNTKIVCLFHGMPIKCIGYDYHGKGARKNKIITQLFRRYAIGYQLNEIDFIISTGPFFVKFLQSAWKNSNIVIKSYPRINYLQDRVKINALQANSEAKTILYMPTHRDYGFGQINPYIFLNDKYFLQFLADYNYKLKYRFHPNMKMKIIDNNLPNEIKDKFAFFEDSQDALLNTEILISDYSSCVFDFLVCEKPILFYHYDDYENNDNKLYYKIESLNIGPCVSNEDDLKKLIQKIILIPNYRDSLISSIIRNRDQYVADTNGWKDYNEFFL